MEDQQILVFQSDVLKKLKIKPGFWKNTKKLSQLLDEAKFSYENRQEMEVNEDYKQLIPYCILRHKDSVFCYKRGKGGGENRLHSLYSVGVGGHSDLEDVLFRKTIKREIQEEIGYEIEELPEPIGFIYDDSTPVGRVHFGIVYYIDVPVDVVKKLEKDIVLDAKMRSLHEIHELNLENWSKMVMEKYP